MSKIGAGNSPEGHALKFVHRGSYDGLDNTYEAITNYLDEKRLESKDMFIEEYVTDPLTTSDEHLIVKDEGMSRWHSGEAVAVLLDATTAHVFDPSGTVLSHHISSRAAH